MNNACTRPAVKFRSYSHVGEFVQGPVCVEDGRTETVVITRPCRAYHSDAKFVRDATCDGVVIADSYRKTCQKFLRRFDEQYGRSFHNKRGRVLIRSNIPVGAGAGSSTCDLHVLCLCLERLAKIRLSRERRQRLIFEAEGASDPLALIEDDSTPVYLSRCGKIYEILPQGLPPMKSVAFRTDVKVVKTNDLVGREGYTEKETEIFAQILNDAKNAVQLGALDLLADASERSATLNQQRVPTRNFNKLISVSKKFNAGFSVSHSGVTGSLFFSPDVPDSVVRAASKALERECDYFDFRKF